MQDLKNYLRILKYLKPYKWLVVLTIVSSLFVASSFGGAIGGVKPATDMLFDQFDAEEYRELPLMNTKLGGMVLDRMQSLSGEEKFTILVVASIGFVILIIVRAIFKFIQGYTGAYLSNRLRMDISIDLHSKIMDQSLSFFSEEGVGDTISVLTYDTNMLHRGAKLIFDKVLLEPLNIGVALAIAFFLNPRLAALAIVGFPVIGYAVNRFGRQIKKNTRKTLRNRASILSLLQESLFGVQVIKSFVMENYERDRFQAENERMLKNEMRAVRARELMSPIVEVVTAVGVGLFILLGGRAVLTGEMKYGDFGAFYLALGAVIAPLRKLSKAVGEVQTSLAGAVRTFDFMDKLPGVEDSPDAVEMPPIKGKVEFDNISFSYDGKSGVIHDIKLAIEPGKVVAFVGHSGAGKTTMINLLQRFYDVTDGVIRIDGIDIRSVKQASLRSQIGLVTQETILFDDTIAGNISYGRTDYPGEQIISAAKAANAHEFITKLENGYETEVGEGGQLLSGGQRQRLAIARTILKNPAIFVLDEATSSLDSESESLIQDALARLIEGRTTFVIAHRLSTIQNADKVVVLDKGYIEAVGRHADLLDSSPIYRNLYEKQLLGPPDTDSEDS
jgi:subfamily B ATP-binding cassette protein MsbA